MSLIMHVLVRLCWLFNICISLRKSGSGIKDTRASFVIASHRSSQALFLFFSFIYLFLFNWRRQWWHRWWFWLIVTTLKLYSQWTQKKLFYSVLFCSVLFHSVFYSILFYSILFCSVPFCSMLVQYLFSIQEMVKEYCMQNCRKRAALT